MGHDLVVVDKGQDRPSGERSQDHLQAELLGDRGEGDEQDHGPAHADLRRGVLQPQEIGADRARSLRSAHRQEHDDRQQEQPPSRSSVARQP